VEEMKGWDSGSSSEKSQHISWGRVGCPESVGLPKKNSLQKRRGKGRDKKGWSRGKAGAGSPTLQVAARSPKTPTTGVTKRGEGCVVRRKPQ